MGKQDEIEEKLDDPSTDPELKRKAQQLEQTKVSKSESSLGFLLWLIPLLLLIGGAVALYFYCKKNDDLDEEMGDIEQPVQKSPFTPMVPPTPNGEVSPVEGEVEISIDSSEESSVTPEL